MCDSGKSAGSGIRRALARGAPGFAVLALVFAGGLPNAACADTNDDVFEVEQDSDDNLLAVLENDDGDGPIVGVGHPSEGGEAAIACDEECIVYTPPSGFTGTETFEYERRTVFLLVERATVTVHVLSPTRPRALDDSYTIDEDTPLDVSAEQGVLANDEDGDDETLTAVLVEGPSNGSLTLAAEGSFRYEPDHEFAGEDAFRYLADDGSEQSDPARVTITVVDRDDAPEIAPIPEQSAVIDTAFELDLRDFVSDDDTAPEDRHFEATGPLPSGLSLSADGLVRGAPPPSTVGRHEIRFRVTDGTSDADGQFDLVVSSGRVDLGVTLSAAPNPALPGTPAAWSVTVTNHADRSADPVTLKGRFSGRVPFSFDPAEDAGCTFTPDGNDTTLACSLGALAAGESIAIELTGIGDQAGDVYASVRVDSNGAPDEHPEDDESATALSLAEDIVTQSAQRLEGFAARAVAAGDLDGDGYTDLAVATDDADSVLVLLNTTDPGNSSKRRLSRTPVSVGSPALDNDVVVADLDGDSDLDIVTAGAADHAPRVLVNDGAAQFRIVTLEGAGDDGRAVAVGDVDVDGYVDLVLANAGPNAFYRGQGVSGAYDDPIYFGEGSSVEVVAADLFGDTRLELVFADRDGDAKIYELAGSAPTQALRLATGPTTSVAAEDVNGDGAVDLLFGRDAPSAASALPSNPLFTNTSAASPGFFKADELGAAPTHAILTDDTDFDGDADAIVLNRTGAHQSFANMSNSSNAFILAPAQLAAAAGSGAALGRFSVDERRDLALARPDGVDVYFNDGTGRFGLGDTKAPTITRLGEASVALEAGAMYEDAGATASDTVDGDLTDEIVVDDPVDTDIVGTYVVSYNVTDSSGNRADTVTRSVEVRAREASGGGGGGASGAPAALGLLLALLARGFRRYGPQSAAV